MIITRIIDTSVSWCRIPAIWLQYLFLPGCHTPETESGVYVFLSSNPETHPFSPDVVVSIDNVLQQKLEALAQTNYSLSREAVTAMKVCVPKHRRIRNPLLKNCFNVLPSASPIPSTNIGLQPVVVEFHFVRHLLCRKP